tara:strand:- start:8025 stop:8882 length:858 start_codon:yes stop_codon:yes gene_type:complete
MKRTLTPKGKGLSEVEANTFSDDLLVPEFNTYYNVYKKANLKPLKRIRDISKTITLCNRRNLYINYRLRASLVSMLYEASETDELELGFITIYFSPEFAEKLSNYDDPVGSYSDTLKKRFAKYDIKDFFIVFEFGNARSAEKPLGGLHVHVVTLMNKSDKESLNEALRKRKEVLIDKKGDIASSAVKILFKYYPKILKSSEHEKTFIGVLADRNPHTKWRRATPEEEARGVVYIAKKGIEINVGLADYLSKQLTQRVFDGSKKNHYVSQSLKKKTKLLVESRIGK